MLNKSSKANTMQNATLTNYTTRTYEDVDTVDKAVNAALLDYIVLATQNAQGDFLGDPECAELIMCEVVNVIKYMQQYNSNALTLQQLVSNISSNMLATNTLQRYIKLA